jgi:transglutaminase-like putative cysteine protease
MKVQKTIAIIMLLTGSVLTALVSGDIAYPTILCMLGLLGLQRRFTWDIKPEKRVITSLLLLLLAIMFSLHYRYAGSAGRVAYVQAAAVAWQTIARYFLASMILILFLGSPERLPLSLGLFHVAVTISAGQVLLLDDMYITFRLSEMLCVILVVLYAAAYAPKLQRRSAAARGTMDTPISEHMGRLRSKVSAAERRIFTTSCLPNPQSTGCLAADALRQKAGVFTFGLILVVTANCGWITSSILYRHVEVFNYLPLWFWRGHVALESTTDGVSLMGFSTSGRLSSLLFIKAEQDSTPALSIASDGSPGYLRARAFEVYRQSEWHDLSYREALFPEQNKPFGMYFVGRTNFFRLNETDASECKYMTIRHESLFADAVFTPLGTSFLEAPLNLLLRDEDDIVYARNLRSALSYRIAYTKSAYRKPPTGPQGRRMLNVPGQLDPRIYQLASRIFAGCSTTTEKIDAVVNYFHTNYTYTLGLDIPPDRDKLTHFLLEESTGYCEYFASGAAILLRLAGVPTRYVTGFLVTEQDARSELWVARCMDAHAWAEAWDRERNQWTIVEATVGENPATASAAEQLGRMSGAAGTLLGQLLQDLYQYGLFGVLGWLFSYGVLMDKSYGLLAGLLLLTLLLGGALWLALSRRYNRKKKSIGRTQSRALRNPALVTLHKMLARMDRKVKALGQRRALSETLHAFSEQLRAQDSGDGLWTKISDWYLEYANLRYRRTISSERLQRLRQLACLCVSRRKSRQQAQGLQDYL